MLSNLSRLKTDVYLEESDKKRNNIRKLDSKRKVHFSSVTWTANPRQKQPGPYMNLLLKHCPSYKFESCSDSRAD